MLCHFPTTCGNLFLNNFSFRDQESTEMLMSEGRSSMLRHLGTGRCPRMEPCCGSIRWWSAISHATYAQTCHDKVLKEPTVTITLE